MDQWVRDRVSAKPPVARNNDFVNELYEQRKEDTGDKKLIKVAMFSDLHVDFTYTEGNNANCGSIVCC